MDESLLRERPRLKDLLREAAANLALGVPVVRRWRVRRGRTVSRQMDAGQQAEAYAFEQFRLVERLVGRESLAGQRVLEVGPGDQTGLGLLFLGAGASQYLACDRFVGDVAGPTARQLYRAITERAPDWARRGWAARGLDPAEYPWTSGEHPPVLLHAVEAERLHRAVTQPVDLIFSYNVVEHLTDVEASFAAMAKVLRPGGLMVHKIDYGPHQCWRDYRNPLLFLTVPEWLWQAMGSRRGVPNRARHCEVVASLRRLGFEIQAAEEDRCDTRYAEAIRERLPAHRRHLSVDDLSVLGSVLLARKW